jgi:hypothetical protein
MVETTGKTLYADLVNVTHKYFGPASDRFIKRQIHNHLNKDPDELVVEDLDMLIDWIKLAMALLVEDERLVNNFVSDLRKLITKEKNKVY